MKKITLVIADDHQLMRESLQLILGNNPEFQILEMCPSAEAAIEAVFRHKPDVLLLDINLPAMNGIEAIPVVLTNAPNTRVIGFSMHSHPSYAQRMIRGGAWGFVTKNSSFSELANAVRSVHQGQRYLCSETKDLICQQQLIETGNSAIHGALTAKELEIIRKIKGGNSVRQIATDLSISVKTVESHRYHILKKLNLPNSAALVHFVHQHVF